MRKFILLRALIGATAAWADSEVQSEETRLGLSPSGARQYGYRIVSSEK